MNITCPYEILLVELKGLEWPETKLTNAKLANRNKGPLTENATGSDRSSRANSSFAKQIVVSPGYEEHYLRRDIGIKTVTNKKGKRKKEKMQ